MNGIHDMGGMHGLGPVIPESEEPYFHEPWEARMFGIDQAMTWPSGTRKRQARPRPRSARRARVPRRKRAWRWRTARTCLLRRNHRT